MALNAWQRTIIDDTGAAIPDAELEVFIAGTTNKPDIFEDASGSTALTNPFNANTNGFARFYVEGGAYDITATGNGSSQTWENVQLGNAQRYDTGTADNELPTQADIRNYYGVSYQPSVCPTIDCNFAEGVSRLYDGRKMSEQDDETIFSVTRGSEATYIAPNGRIKTAGVDELRYQYDPETGEALGILIEEQRTNLLTYSEDFTKDDWVKTNATIDSTNTIVAPDGENDAQKIVEDTQTAVTHGVFKRPSYTDGKTYTLSSFVKASERNFVQIKLHGHQASFDLSNGSVPYANSSIDDYGIVEHPDGWYQIWITQTFISGDAQLTLIGPAKEAGFDGHVYDGDGTSGIYVWGAQVEEGPAPSSYIPTTDAQVTRGKDRYERTLGDEHNPIEGTVLIEISEIRNGNSNGEVVKLMGPNTANGENFIWFRQVSPQGYVDLFCRVDGTTTADSSNLQLPAIDKKAAFTYHQDSGYVLYIDGNEMDAFTGVGLVPTNVDTIKSDGAVYSARAIKYYPRALSATELEELTK